LPRRPKVYFEEWDEPLISGIQWVAELVRIAGGDDIFPERAAEPLAKQRILDDRHEVVRRAPDIIFGSWCGKKFRPDKVAARARLGGDPRRARWRTARDQVADHPAAGARPR
jgi:iron complex transport system substrate-binding protein